MYTGELIDLTTVYDDQDVIHTEVQNVKNQIINTTVGRVILNDHLPKGVPYINGLLRKKGLRQLVQYGYLRFGLEKTVEMLDAIKDLGFTYATRAGISIGIDDLVIPEGKERMVTGAQKEVLDVEKQYLDGAITNGERYNKVIAIWSNVTEKVADAMFKEMEKQDKEGRSSTRSTSWPTRAPADPSSRSASSPGCAASWRVRPARSSRTRSPRTSAKASPCCSTSSPPTARARAWPTPRSRPPTPAT